MNRAAILVVAALVVAACGGSVESPPGLVDPTEAASEALESIEPEPTTEPASEAPVATPKPLPVSLVSRTQKVSPGNTASVTVDTAKGAECSISVEYESGESEAAGLGDKRAKAKADGEVTWRWLVGINTNPQRADIFVMCFLGERDGSLSTVIRVTR
jgi:hypothetical protein